MIELRRSDSAIVQPLPLPQLQKMPACLIWCNTVIVHSYDVCCIFSAVSHLCFTPWGWHLLSNLRITWTRVHVSQWHLHMFGLGLSHVWHEHFTIVSCPCHRMQGCCLAVHNIDCLMHNTLDLWCRELNDIPTAYGQQTCWNEILVALTRRTTAMPLTIIWVVSNLCFLACTKVSCVSVVLRRGNLAHWIGN